MVDDRSLRPLGIGIAWPIYIEMRKESKVLIQNQQALPFRAFPSSRPPAIGIVTGSFRRNENLET